MIFNTYSFLTFILFAFFLYWFIFNQTAKSQNILLFFASLVFYSWIDWRFLGLILFNASFNFIIGLRIFSVNNNEVKIWLLRLGILVNISILGFYKYFNFFIENVFEVFGFLGLNMLYNPLNVVIPLGISFITFQTLGYIIDVYNEELNPTKDFIAFATYVVYFPKLLAGPIERAGRFLPQINQKRIFDRNLATDGLRQILLGLFKKVVIADSCATIANPIFDQYQSHSGSTLFIALFFYVFQIYCDFSGYSDIAIGLSKLFGIRLMQNFSTPFFSTNISEFWKKWHISLTSWMMDYVFKPLSFNLRRYNRIGISLAIISTFIIVGLWHGPKWTYIFYGFLHGLYFIPMIYKKKSNNPLTTSDDNFFSLRSKIQMIGLFLLLMVTAVFFRSDTLSQGFDFIGKFFTLSLFSMPVLSSRLEALILLIPIVILMFLEYKTRGKEHAFSYFNSLSNVKIRWFAYILITLIVVNYSGDEQQFIYFKF